MGSKAEAMAWSRRHAGCNWQCIWAFAMAASMLVYSLAIIVSSSSAPPSAAIACAQQESQAMAPCASCDLQHWRGDLRQMGGAWNRLCFGRVAAPEDRLRIALFVKKWPIGGVPGGLERHAMTLHEELARRGHEVHVYTASPDASIEEQQQSEELESGGSLQVHFFKPTQGGGFDHNRAWQAFLEANSSSAFDVVHSESVALPHWRASQVTAPVAASWHGIGYEIIHSDLVQDLMRKPGEARGSELQRVLSERLPRVAEEIRFFPEYRHHVATSDYVADVLRTVYMIPVDRVHTVLNGVDAARFRPDPAAGAAFRAKFGVPVNATLVLGAAGRLVRDKGHPLLFEAISRILAEYPGVFLLVAGHGPWGDRYRELAPNVKTLGAMPPDQLASFYNAIDVFVNPTLRSQGLDHTLLEAMQCGKPLLATHFSSITWSVVVSSDIGYTFSPTQASLVAALRRVIEDGRERLHLKGRLCQQYAQLMFTAQKMGSAYERLFLCLKNQTYCRYPLPGDCAVQPSRYSSFRL